MAATAITELGGFTQNCEFDKGLYLNPGPWRIPYHHHGILHYCQRAERGAAALRPGRLQRASSTRPRRFGGKPQRYRHVQADFNG